MAHIWEAAREGDVGDVERLVGQGPGLLNARDAQGTTPLMWASTLGHIGVVRCLLDKGAAINEKSGECGPTALGLACLFGRTLVARVLLERGADPTIVDRWGRTPMMLASSQGHLEDVRLLLGHPSAKATTNRRGHNRETALWKACFYGHAGVARLLLASGADPTIADKNGTTAMALWKQKPAYFDRVYTEGRRECVAALEVSF
jgi:uncharacterized protein